MIFQATSPIDLRNIGPGDDVKLVIEMFRWAPYNALSDVRKDEELVQGFAKIVYLTAKVTHTELSVSAGRVLCIEVPMLNGKPVELVLFVEKTFSRVPRAFLMDMETYELSMTREVGDTKSA